MEPTTSTDMFTDIVTGELEKRDATLPSEVIVLLQMYENVKYVAYVYLAPILTAIGIYSNIVAAIALWKRAKKHSTYNYLVGLALVDTAYLVILTLFWFIGTGFGLDLQILIDCNIVQLLIYGPVPLFSI